MDHLVPPRVIFRACDLCEGGEMERQNGEKDAGTRGWRCGVASHAEEQSEEGAGGAWLVTDLTAHFAIFFHLIFYWFAKNGSKFFCFLSSGLQRTVPTQF